MPNTANPVFAKTAILQVLQDGPGYGSEIVERIKTKSKNSVTLSAGAIYPVLKSTEEEGLIAKAKKEGRADIYRLTPSGKTAAAHNKKTIKALFDL